MLVSPFSVAKPSAQDIQDDLYEEFQIFIERNSAELNARDLVRLNNIFCTRGFFDTWFPTMRAFDPTHGACHTEILAQGLTTGLHNQDVHKILQHFIKPPLSVGGTGNTEDTYQGLTCPLTAQMHTLLVTDYAGTVMKALTCHQLMMLVLLPSVYQANWPVRKDEPKNGNNFLSLGEHSSGKTWLFECISEMLCISSTVKNIARLTAAGLDGGDENGFMWIMDELGLQQLSDQGKNPIKDRIKSALTSKANGVQETGMEPDRHSKFTNHENPTGWMGASNVQLGAVDPALASRALVAFPTRDSKRKDGLKVADMTHLTDMEDSTSQYRLRLKEKFFVPVQYCMAMLSNMISCKVLFGNYELAYRSVKELVPMLFETWGVKVETRHLAMIFNLIRIHTSMKTIILGLFFPAVRRRCVSDAEISKAKSLEEVVFMLGQRTLVASQDIGFYCMGVLIPFLYEMDIDLVVCYLLTQMEGFPRSQDLNSPLMDTMFRKETNYPISSLGVSTEGGMDAATGNLRPSEGIKRDFNYLMLTVDLPELQEYLEQRTGMSPQQSHRYMEILSNRSVSFFDRERPACHREAPVMGPIVPKGMVLIVKKIPVASGLGTEAIDVMKKQSRVLINVQYVQEKLQTLLDKETPAATHDMPGRVVVPLKAQLSDYHESVIARSEWTSMLQRTCQLDFPEGLRYMTGFTLAGHPHLLHRHPAENPTAPAMKISTRFQQSRSGLRRMGLTRGNTAEPSSKRTCIQSNVNLALDYKFPHAFCWWTAMEKNGIYPWVHDPEFAGDALLISLGHISFEALAVDEAQEGTDEAVPSNEARDFPKDYLDSSEHYEAPVEVAQVGDGRHVPLYRVAIAETGRPGHHKFFGLMHSAKEKLESQ